MKELWKTAVIATITLSSLGCQSLQPGQATLMTTNGDVNRPGLVHAVICEIDGRSVSSTRDQYSVAPGRHTVRVWPRLPGKPNFTRAFGAFAESNINVGSLTVDVEPGDRLAFAAIVRTHRTGFEDANGRSAQDPWQTTILPVVYRRN